MKVKDLIKALKTADQNADVVMSSDEEGNSYRLAKVDPSKGQVYEAVNSFEIEVAYAELTPELTKHGYTEEDTKPDGTPCIVIW